MDHGQKLFTIIVQHHTMESKDKRDSRTYIIKISVGLPITQNGSPRVVSPLGVIG